jgi:hypothetical protein
MKPLLDTLLFLAWVLVYLLAISWVTHYRKARIHALGPMGRSDYRADKDIILRLTVFVVGILLFVLVYVATNAVSHIL